MSNVHRTTKYTAKQPFTVQATNTISDDTTLFVHAKLSTFYQLFRLKPMTWSTTILRPFSTLTSVSYILPKWTEGNLEAKTGNWHSTGSMRPDCNWTTKFCSQWTSYMEPSATSTTVTGPVGERNQIGTEDTPVLKHLLSSRRLSDFDAAYKYPDLLTYLLTYLLT